MVRESAEVVCGTDLWERVRRGEIASVDLDPENLKVKPPRPCSSPMPSRPRTLLPFEMQDSAFQLILNNSQRSQLSHNPPFPPPPSPPMPTRRPVLAPINDVNESVYRTEIGEMEKQLASKNAVIKHQRATIEKQQKLIQGFCELQVHQRRRLKWHAALRECVPPHIKHALLPRRQSRRLRSAVSWTLLQS